MQSGRFLAAIDIGTNSLHLVVAQAGDGQRFQVVARDKEMARLGSGPGDMKVLEPGAIDRGIAALSRFRQVADISGAEVRAVATSAVREAENRGDFLERARREARIEVEVISGAEEARLIHLGVLQAVPVFDRRVLVVDIGGGSTELLVGRAGEVLEARSFKLGTIRLTDRFFRHEPVRPDQIEVCRRHVRAFLQPVASDFRRHGFEVVVGSSGTILNLAEMARARRGGGAARGPGDASVSSAELEAVIASLARAPTVEKRLKIDGLEPKRADIILAGAILLEGVIAELGIDSMVMSDFALREGVILDQLQRSSDATLHHLGDLRYRSVVHLADICPEERPHAEQTTRLALAIYDGCSHLHHLDHDCREYLEAAGLLANVGLFISHSRHHRHSYYIIRNAEHLTGFTDREVELIAQVARYHRKSTPKAKHEEFARLSSGDQGRVRALAGILRVAVALDRTRAGVVRSLTCRRSGARLALHLDTGGRDASLEIYTAEGRKDLLEATLGVEVRFVVGHRADQAGASAAAGAGPGRPT
ncbi:MAG: exopolyphosphatase [Acidimicrobiales bacterium]